MSKGLGHIERAVLRHLPPAPDHADAVMLTALVYRVEIPEERDLSGWHQLHGRVTNAQRVAVRRALANLKRKGLVEEVGDRWARGRGHWRLAPVFAEPEAAAAAIKWPPGVVDQTSERSGETLTIIGMPRPEAAKDLPP